MEFVYSTMLSSTDSGDSLENFQRNSRYSRRSILKVPDTEPSKERRKSTHWDENNIRNTLQLEGQVTDCEKQTKLLYEVESSSTSIAQNTVGNLNDKCRKGSLQDVADENVVDKDEYVQLEKKLELQLQIDQEKSQKKKEFEEKRKAHYNEFKALLASKELMKYYEDNEQDGQFTGTEETENIFFENSEDIVQEAELNLHEGYRKRLKIDSLPKT